MGTPHPLRSLSLIQQNAQRLLTSTRWGRRSRRAATRIGANANFDDQTAIASRGTGRDPHQRALSRYRSACGRRRRARLSALSGSSPTAGRAHRRRAGRPLDPRQIETNRGTGARPDQRSVIVGFITVAAPERAATPERLGPRLRRSEPSFGPLGPIAFFGLLRRDYVRHVAVPAPAVAVGIIKAIVSPRVLPAR